MRFFGVIAACVLVDRTIAYVVLVNLDVEEAPETPLGLLSKQPE